LLDQNEINADMRSITIAIVLFFSTVISYKNPLMAQCASITVPYENYFSTSSSLNCWNTNPGIPSPTYWVDRIRFNDAGQVGFSSLVSPQILITTPVHISYSWEHLMTAFSPGLNDSLDVYVRRTTDSNWTLIKNYPVPFFSPSNISPSFGTPVYEELALDSSYVNDTVRVLFRFYAGSNAQYMILDNFRVTAQKIDTTYNLPFFENFDGPTWRPDSSTILFENHFKIDDDWRTLPGTHKDDGSFRWVVEDSNTPSSNTGPANDYSGNGNYLFTESSAWGSNTYLYLPLIDLSGSSTPEMSFWYHMYGLGMGTLHVERLVNQQWTVLDSIKGQQQTSTSDPWRKHTLLLDSAGISQLRFRMRGNWSDPSYFTQDAAIDEVRIETALCPYPNKFEVTFTSNGLGTIMANWTPGPNSNAYIIEYGLSGFVPGTGQIDTSYGVSIPISGLQTNQVYDFYIQLLCGLNDTSVIRGPFQFHSDCLEQAPFIETFNDTVLNPCWKIHNQTANNEENAQWKPTRNMVFPAYGAQNAKDHTGNGGSAIGVDGSQPYPLDSIAILTPYIDVSQLTLPKVKFWLFSNNTTSSAPNSNNSFYLDFYDGSQWHYNALSYSGNDPNWVEISMQLNHYSISGLVRFRLVVDKHDLPAAFNNDIVIDDFEVYDDFGISCPIPDSLQAFNIGCDSVTLAWNSTQANGLTRIKYGPVGFDFKSSGNWINNVNSPFKIIGLTAGQNYDLYVVDSCSDGLGISQSISISTDTSSLSSLNYTFNVIGYTDSTVTYLFDARNTPGANQFEWEFDNGTILQGDTAVWTYDRNFNHWVTLRVFNSCGVSSKSFNVLVTDIGSAEYLGNEPIRAFPNPSKGIISFNFTQNQDQRTEILLYDIAGYLVYKSVLEPQERESVVLDFSHLQSGAYFLWIRKDDLTQQVEKIILAK
jgi:hypothetical protein